jgi:hypothetical protein
MRIKLQLKAKNYGMQIANRRMMTVIYMMEVQYIAQQAIHFNQDKKWIRICKKAKGMRNYS